MDFVKLFIPALLVSCVTTGTPSSPTQVIKDHREKLYRVEIRSDFIGTAFALDIGKGKYLVTAGHVCDVFTLEQVKPMPKHAVASDGVSYSITDFKVSSDHDVCVMGKLPDDAEAFTLALENHVEDVWVLGFPAGRPLSATHGAVVGFAKAKIPMPQRAKENCNSEAFKWELIQLGFFATEMCVAELTSLDTTAQGAPGSSGGPVINANAEVIGIVSYSDTATPGFLSIVPVEEIKKLVGEP
jgi:S1-C subfamily serine protease